MPRTGVGARRRNDDGIERRAERHDGLYHRRWLPVAERLRSVPWTEPARDLPGLDLMRFPCASHRPRPRYRQASESAAVRRRSSRARHRIVPYDLRILGLKVLGQRSGTLCVPTRLPTTHDSQFAPVSDVIAERQLVHQISRAHAIEPGKRNSVSASLAPRARCLTDIADSACGESRRPAIWPSTDQPPKPVSCASVKSISTWGGRGSTVFIAHLRGDGMLTGNIAGFARSVRVFSDPVPALSGNQGLLCEIQEGL